MRFHYALNVSSFRLLNSFRTFNDLNSIVKTHFGGTEKNWIPSVQCVWSQIVTNRKTAAHLKIHMISLLALRVVVFIYCLFCFLKSKLGIEFNRIGHYFTWKPNNKNRTIIMKAVIPKNEINWQSYLAFLHGNDINAVFNRTIRPHFVSHFLTGTFNKKQTVCVQNCGSLAFAFTPSL